MFSKLIGILMYYSIVSRLFVVICVLNNELFIFKQISEKDMGLLKERLKRASKNRVVRVATIQPTQSISSKLLVGTVFKQLGNLI